MDIPNYLGRRKFTRYLQNSFTSLKKGGLLIFDVSSEYKLKEIMKNETFIFDTEDVFYVWRNRYREYRVNSFVDMDIEFFIKNGLDSYDRINECQRMYVLKSEMIEKISEDTGFEILAVRDGYTEKDADPESTRITYVLRRR